jgi:hypothetical protein
MKNALIQQNLASAETYIKCACTAHNDQTNLRVTIETIYGVGGLDERNVLQLAHAYNDLQEAFDGKQVIAPYLTVAWKLCKGQNSQPTNDFLLLMQEPILTRWKTVGQALQYIYKYLDVLLIFARAVCATQNNVTQMNKCASNFKSLAEQSEIQADVGFLADFDCQYFDEHFEFNHHVDPKIGRSGFLPHQHLVRYFLKHQDLEAIKKELDDGSAEHGAPYNAKYTRYWDKLAKVKNDERDEEPNLEKDKMRKEAAHRRAKAFPRIHSESLHKHKNQFCDSRLSLLQCFGELNTARIVAIYLISLSEEPDCDITLEDLLQGGGTYSFESKIHKRDIDCGAFAAFVIDRCRDGGQECVKTKNFEQSKQIVKRIAEGIDFWHATDGQADTDRMFYREHFSALPSTTEDVE